MSKCNKSRKTSLVPRTSDLNHNLEHLFKTESWESLDDMWKAGVLGLNKEQYMLVKEKEVEMQQEEKKFQNDIDDFKADIKNLRFILTRRILT